MIILAALRGVAAAMVAGVVARAVTAIPVAKNHCI